MDFYDLSAECAPWVAPQTMAAIVKTESQFNPLAININGGAKLERQPLNKAEAVVTAKWLITNHYSIDMGLGQVNSANLAKTNLSVEDAFDACKNLTAAATILQSNYESASKKVSGEQAALHAAISAYNTGSFTRGFQNGYVQKVLTNAAVSTPATSTSVADAQRSAIVPIALVNTEKTAAGKQKMVTQKIDMKKADLQKVDLQKNSDQKGMDIVRLSAAQDINDKSFSVYGDNSVAPNVMVYQ